MGLFFTTRLQMAGNYSDARLLSGHYFQGKGSWVVLLEWGTLPLLSRQCFKRKKRVNSNRLFLYKKNSKAENSLVGTYPLLIIFVWQNLGI